jgi:quercetin dioxygenase-like cupin family protein
MRRTMLVLGLTLAVGVAIGVIGTQVPQAQQQVTRTELMRTELEGIEGKEGVVYTAVLPPGAVIGKHYHPGNDFVYILEGSVILEREGEAPVTFGPGQLFHNAPKRVHNVKNASTTEGAKLLVFQIPEKGQPLTTPVK